MVNKAFKTFDLDYRSSLELINSQVTLIDLFCQSNTVDSIIPDFGSSEVVTVTYDEDLPLVPSNFAMVQITDIKRFTSTDSKDETRGDGQKVKNFLANKSIINFPLTLNKFIFVHYRAKA